MSEIPEDVMKTASKVWAALPKESAGITAIARAIMAERERCAKVAEAECQSASLSIIVPTVANAIAAAIRNGREA